MCPFNRDRCYGQCSECEANGYSIYNVGSAMGAETKRTEEGVTVTEPNPEKPLYYRNGKLTDAPKKGRPYKPGQPNQ